MKIQQFIKKTIEETKDFNIVGNIEFDLAVNSFGDVVNSSDTKVKILTDNKGNFIKKQP